MMRVWRTRFTQTLFPIAIYRNAPLWVRETGMSALNERLLPQVRIVCLSVR
jgi:hypothetical protein